MGTRSYSFLDTAAMPEVGPRLAAGDALIVLDANLSTVLWTNGAGARLFGAIDPLGFIGSDPALRGPVRRQIEATSGFPRIGRDRNLLLRLAGGLFSRTTAFSASEIGMPDGEAGILLAATPARPNASSAIDGLSGEGQFAALIDGSGNIVAAAEGFSALGIGAATLAAVATEVRGEADRMVKRPLQGSAGMLPAGIALLRDEPPLSLLVVVEEADETVEAPTTVTEAEMSVEPLAVDRSNDGVGETAIVEDAVDAPGEVVAGPDETPSGDDADDRWYFNGRANRAEGSADEKEELTPAADDSSPRLMVERAAVPVRFVWRTDAEGRFSAISDEFRIAFGAGAADVVGRSFVDVSRVFDLDPDGEIAGLLERRDTWSGRAVLWPVSGTDLRVPVDLAALPVYGRERNFEGFRGFGVARMGDAVIDPEALGLTLGGSVVPDSDGQAIEARPDTQADDPFMGEVPALTVAQTPERRDTDKVIRLAERRPAARDLSATEQNNFREIGEKLKGTAGDEGDAPSNPHASDVPPPAAQPADSRPSMMDTAPETEGLESASEEQSTPAAVSDPIAEADAAITAILANELSENAAEAAEQADEQTAAEFIEPPLDTGPDVSVDVPIARSEESEASESAAEAVEPSGIQPVYENRDKTVAADDTPVESVDAPLVVTEERDESIDLGAFAAANYDAAIGESLTHATASDENANDAESPALARDGNASASESVHLDEPVTDADIEQADDDGIGTLSPADEMIEAADEETEQFGLAASELAPDDPQPSELVEQEAPDDKPDLATVATGDDKAVGKNEAGISGSGPQSVEITGDDTEDQAGDDEELPDIRAVDTAVLARLPLPIVIHRGDALYYANRDFLQMTGYGSLEELDLAGGLGALFGDPYRQGDERKLRLQKSDGSEIPVDAFLQSVAWNGGKALLLSLKPVAEASLAPANDADGREARLSELRTIIDTATDGVVLIENDGTIRSISRPAEALFGFEAEEVRGKPFSTLFAMESQRAARDYLAGLADNGVASVLNDGREVIGRESQGRFIPLFMSIGRLPKESGYCAVVRDITQFKRTEEELTQARAQAERASSQKTDFLARVSHEIRTPLNAIIGFSELMMDEKFGPITNERYKDYLRDINRSGNHVLDLVNDLLDISKIEAGQLELNYEAVSLNETLADAVAMMQPQANRERVIIRSSLASKLPDVVADLRSIRQIALNLLSNAIRYTPAGGQVIISTSYEATGDILMRVRDTGIGMAAAEIEQALKPFKQINALKRPRGDGTGLGLPLTKAMVEANRARFAIQSTPGEGTLVEITFPSTRVLAH